MKREILGDVAVPGGGGMLILNMAPASREEGGSFVYLSSWLIVSPSSPSEMGCLKAGEPCVRKMCQASNLQGSLLETCKLRAWLGVGWQTGRLILRCKNPLISRHVGRFIILCKCFGCIPFVLHCG